MKTNHIHGLDILRLLSALAVVFYHYTFRGVAAGEMQAIHVPAFMVEITKYGHLGVSVFFIISGYVIAYSAEGQGPYKFFVSRFSRLYPTFLIMMTLSTLVLVASGSALFDVTPRQYIANLFVFSKLAGEKFVDGAYWSIVLEIIFYGWVFLLISLNKFDKLVQIIPFWLVLSLVNETLIQNEHLQNLFITEYSGFFAVGILINRLRSQFSYTAVALLVLSAVYGIFTAIKGADWSEVAYSTTYSRPVIAAIIIVSIGVFIAALNVKVNARYWGLASLLGGATYPIYLFHQNVGYLIVPKIAGFMPGMVAILVATAGMLLFALAFHVVVERKLNSAVRKSLMSLGLRTGLQT